MMERIIWTGRILLLAVSCYGYLRYISRKVRIELAIGLLFAGISSLMFISGLLNILRDMAWIIFSGGIFLAILSIKRRDQLKDLKCPGILFFCIAAAYFFLLLYGSKFTFYDNFTHWGIVTKAMTTTDHFPDSQTVNLGHTSYPVGSGCFIYFVTEIIGIAPEWLQMWAQVILMTGMIVGVFVFVESLEQNLIAIVGSLILLCCNISFVDLPVDTLLPIVAVNAVVFCTYYREHFSTRIILVLPYLIFLTSIKNSGFFFILIILVYSLVLLKKEEQSIIKWSFVAIVPLMVWLFWKGHVRRIFGTDISRHSMSIANYKSVFSGKTVAENIETINAFWEKFVTNIDGPILLMVIILGIWLFQTRNNLERDKNCKWILRIVVVSYVVYQIGLLIMYLVSMPISEAKIAAQYYRYHQTILIFCGGLLLINILQEARVLYQLVQQKKHRLIMVVMILGVFCVALQPNFSFYTKQDLENTDRLRFDGLIEQYEILNKGRYLLLIAEERYGDFYLTHMARYLLEPEFVAAKPIAYIDKESVEDYDYIILFDETEETRTFMNEYSGEKETDVIKLARN